MTRLTFTGAAATDPQGASYPISAEEWKGIVALAARSPDGTTAGRALPANALDYKDGLGPLRRHAYLARPEGDNVLVFTEARTLDDDSKG